MNHTMWIIVKNCCVAKVVCTFAWGHPLLWKDVMWNFICTNETRVIVLNANFCCANKPRLIWYRAGCARACPRKKLNTKGIYVIVILKSWANMDGCIRQRCQESSKNVFCPPKYVNSKIFTSNNTGRCALSFVSIETRQQILTVLSSSYDVAMMNEIYSATVLYW